MEEDAGSTEKCTITTQLTVRVSNIPRAITSESFLSFFGAFIEENTPQERKGRKNIILWSYAPSAISIDSEHECAATVTLQDVPSILLCGQKEIVLGNAEHLFTVMVDTHFTGVTQLNNPTEKITVDIFAVTGIAGHAFGSWKSRKAPTMWLRDFLPKAFPSVRILTYGYDSTLIGSESKASIREFAGGLLQSLKTVRALMEEQCRPIIFIAHSLGGLVIKQALIKAAQGNQQDQLIFNACYGMLFFGVPNRGLNVQAMRSMVKGQPNAKLIEDLDPSSDALRLLHQAFCEKFIFEESRITSIYETKLTKTVMESPRGVWRRAGPMVLMVSETSATYSGPTEKRYDQLSIDSNHSDMVKFSDRNNMDYLAVRQRIFEFVKEAPAVIMKRFPVGELGKPINPDGGGRRARMLGSKKTNPSPIRPDSSPSSSQIPLRGARAATSTCPSPPPASTQALPAGTSKGKSEEHPSQTASAHQTPCQSQRQISGIVLATTENHCGRKAPLDLRALTGRALGYQKRGCWKEALAEWVQVVTASKQLLGEYNPRTLVSMARLAVIYGKMGRFEECQDMWIHIVALNKRVHGENHPDTLTASARLASAYMEIGRMKEARSLWASVVPMMERVLGNDHHHTLAARTRQTETYEN